MKNNIDLIIYNKIIEDNIYALMKLKIDNYHFNSFVDILL